MPIFDLSGNLRVVGDRAGNVAIIDPTGSIVNYTAQFIRFSGSAVASVTSVTSGVLVELTGGGAAAPGSTTFTKGALFNWPVVARNVITWRSEGSHTLGSIRALLSGSTGATASFQAYQNGTNVHLSATLNVTANNTWFNGGTVATGSYVAGDYLQIRLLGISGTVEYAIIQADFTG